MSELTPEMLAELKRLEQAATKVEWELFAEAMMLAVMAPGQKCIAGNVLKSDHDPWNYDAQLIAALRNAAPALIAAAEECERLDEIRMVATLLWTDKENHDVIDYTNDTMKRLMYLINEHNKTTRRLKP